MLHMLFEISPLLSGLLVGLLGFPQFKNHALRGGIVGVACLVIGSAFSFVAGELNHGLAEALTCVALDSAAVAVGWAVAHFFLKRITARPER